MTRVRFAWFLLAVSIGGMALCLGLYLADQITDTVMIVVTLALSWLALTFTALDILWTAHVRDDIEHE